MQDPAPRGFARIPPDVINLVGWVLLLGGIGGVVEPVIRLAPYAAAHGHLHLWSWFLRLNSYYLIRNALQIVASVGLLLRRRWSVDLFLALCVFAILVAIGMFGAGVWAYCAGRLANHLIPELLAGGAGVVVNVLILRWLWRFRREFKPSLPLPSESEV
jgi:nitrate reductase NapE component